MIKTEILWESDSKTLDGKPFITVKRARNYFIYAERGGIDSIAFILYDDNIKRFALIKEAKPPFDEAFEKEAYMKTAFGGSIDTDTETYKQICQQEVLEESGYKVPLERIWNTGETVVSTQMSQICYTYMVDVTGIEKTEKAEYEMNDTEENVIWMTYNELMDLGEWKSLYIANLAIFRGYIECK